MLRGVILGGLLASLASLGLAAETGTILFDIPQKRADLALLEFSRQADIAGLFPFDEISRATANELIGEYELEDALRILLNGTGFTARLEGRDQFVVSVSSSDEGESDMPKQTGFFAGLLAAVLGGAAGTSVEAQGPTAAPVLEEVIVTARRRAEALQDLPLSVAVLDAEGLVMRGVTRLSDLDHAIPNATFRGGEIRPEDTDNFHIRGVPGVATYVDGIVSASGQNLLSRGMIELQRVEVLRGPQGTLFGRQSTGGALQLITVPPSDEFGVRGGFTTGEYNQRDADITLDIPAGDTLLTKLTASYRSADGYQKSVLSDFALGDLNDTVLRGDLLWSPSTDLNIRFNYTNTEFDRNGAAIALVETLPDNLDRLNRYGIAEVAGLNVSNDFLRVGGSQLGLRETWSTYGEARMDEDFYSLDVNWNIGDIGTLRFIGANIDQTTDYMIDNDFSPYNLTDSWRHRVAEENSAELQYLFDTDRFHGVIGLYSLSFGTRQSVVGTRDTEYLNDQAAQDAILASGANGIIFDRRTRSLSMDSLRTRAIYGEVDFDLSAQWQLTLGVRYNEDSQRDYQMLSTAGVSPPDTVPYIASESPNALDNGYSGDPFRGEITQILPSEFTSTTGRAAVRYRINPDVMVYASYAQGFSSGGINVEGPPLFPPDTIIPYDPETVDNYEFGLRSDWRNGQVRLNATLFRIDWDDIHLPVPRINPATGEAERGSWTVNAGKGKINGLELELRYRPTGQLWELHFNSAWLNTEYTDIGDTTSVTEGSAFANAPEYSLDTGASRDIVLAGGRLRTRLQYSWMDDQRLHQDDFRANVQEAFGLWNGSVTYEPNDANWRITLAGTNLTNEWYTTSGFNSGALGTDARALGRPRQISLEFRFLSL